MVFKINATFCSTGVLGGKLPKSCSNRIVIRLRWFCTVGFITPLRCDVWVKISRLAGSVQMYGLSWGLWGSEVTPGLVKIEMMSMRWSKWASSVLWFWPLPNFQPILMPTWWWLIKWLTSRISRASYEADLVLGKSCEAKNKCQFLSWSEVIILEKILNWSWAIFRALVRSKLLASQACWSAMSKKTWLEGIWRLMNSALNKKPKVSKGIAWENWIGLQINEYLFHKCWGQDLNLRRLAPPLLQRGPIDRTPAPQHVVTKNRLEAGVWKTWRNFKFWVLRIFIFVTYSSTVTGAPVSDLFGSASQGNSVRLIWLACTNR